MPSDSSLDLNINCLTSNHRGLNTLRVCRWCVMNVLVRLCVHVGVCIDISHIVDAISQNISYFIGFKPLNVKRDMAIAAFSWLHTVFNLVDTPRKHTQNTRNNTRMDTYTLSACLENNCILSNNCQVVNL